MPEPGASWSPEKRSGMEAPKHLHCITFLQPSLPVGNEPFGISNPDLGEQGITHSCPLWLCLFLGVAEGSLRIKT